MRRFASDIAVVLMLAIFLGGIAAVIAAPGGAASKTALGIAVFAALLAAANFATSPNWDELAEDIRRIRQAAEAGRTGAQAPTPAVFKLLPVVPWVLIWGAAIAYCMGRRARHR
jgi:hypothetical protein